MGELLAVGQCVLTFIAHSGSDSHTSIVMNQISRDRLWDQPWDWSRERSAPETSPTILALRLGEEPTEGVGLLYVQSSCDASTQRFWCTCQLDETGDERLSCLLARTCSNFDL